MLTPPLIVNRPVVLYNSLAHRRTQLVWVRTSVPHVQVQDPQGKVVHSQTEPYLEESSGSGAEFKVGLHVCGGGGGGSKVFWLRMSSFSSVFPAIFWGFIILRFV